MTWYSYVLSTVSKEKLMKMKDQLMLLLSDMTYMFATLWCCDQNLLPDLSVSGYDSTNAEMIWSSGLLFDLKLGLASKDISWSDHEKGIEGPSVIFKVRLEMEARLSG